MDQRRNLKIKYFKLNENIIYQNLWDAEAVFLTGKIIDWMYVLEKKKYLKISKFTS